MKARMEHEYSNTYYSNIWRSILSKYTIESPVFDLGDLSRQQYVHYFINDFLSHKRFSDEIAIYDFGAGNWLYLGEILRAIAAFDPYQHHHFTITGVDYSGDALTFGIRKYEALIPANVTITQRVGNLLEIVKSIDAASCDLVISLETLEHLYEHEILIEHTSRILKSTGRVIYSTPNKHPTFLSMNWLIYVFLRKRFSEKDKNIGHLRRYSLEDYHQLANKYGMQLLQSKCYGFFLSGYVKKYASLLEKHSRSKLEKRFPLLKRIVAKENELCNRLNIKHSEGIFVYLSNKD